MVVADAARDIRFENMDSRGELQIPRTVTTISICAGGHSQSKEFSQQMLHRRAALIGKKSSYY